MHRTGLSEFDKRVGIRMKNEMNEQNSQNREKNMAAEKEICTSDILKMLHTDWAGRNPVFYPETGSTNTDAAELAAAGAAHGTLVIADRQKAGRGRRGRVWESPARENIFMSMVLRPRIAAEKAPMLTLVMALALAEGISDISGVQAGIKWPNDIVIHRHKICGILTEMQMNSDGSIRDVVIGAGINVNMQEFPASIRDMAGSLYTETGEKYDRNELIACVLEHFEKDYDIFVKAESLAPLKTPYEERLLNLGQEVRVLDPAGEYTGKARGITLTGELTVERENGNISEVNAGEVSVRGLYGYV